MRSCIVTGVGERVTVLGVKVASGGKFPPVSMVIVGRSVVDDPGTRAKVRLNGAILPLRTVCSQSEELTVKS